MKRNEARVTIRIRKSLADLLVDLAKQGSFGPGFISMDLDGIVEHFVATRVKSGRTRLRRIQTQREEKEQLERTDKAAQRAFKAMGIIK